MLRCNILMVIINHDICAEHLSRNMHFQNSLNAGTLVIIILVIPPVAFQSMPGTADGDAISRCQVLNRAGSAHHGADQ